MRADTQTNPDQADGTRIAQANYQTGRRTESGRNREELRSKMLIRKDNYMKKLYLAGAAAAIFGLCACSSKKETTTTYVPEPQPARVIVQAPPPAPVIVAPATTS